LKKKKGLSRIVKTEKKKSVYETSINPPKKKGPPKEIPLGDH